MQTNNMNAEAENPAVPSCAPWTTPSAAGAAAVASAAESAAETAAPQARPITSFFQREEASTCTLVAAAASTAAAAGTEAGANVEATALPQQPVSSATRCWGSQWHAQAPRHGQDAASTRNR